MQPGVESTVEPFLVLEPEPAARLESVPLASPPVAPPRGRGSTALFGVVLLLVGMPALWAVWLVSALFDRGAAFGWSGVALLLAGFGLIAVGIAREMRALWRVRRVDRLRAGLASGDTARVAAAARGWLAILPQHAAILPAVSAADSPGAILALLRAGPGLALREATDAHGRAAAFQAVALVAATPAPALDALSIGWCGIRLVRQVAALHGLRPGALGTLSLLRKTALAAATVAATEMAVNMATHAVIAHPLLRHVVGDAAGAAIAARRMMLLARATAIACSPLPP